MKFFSFIFVFMIFGGIQEIFAQDSLYLYGSNFRPVESLKEAKIRKQVFNPNGKRTRIKNYVKTESGWKYQKTTKIKNAGKGIQKISVIQGKFFPEKKTRIYSVDTTGNYSFREYSKGLLVRSGRATNLVPISLQDTVKHYFPSGNLKSVEIYDGNQLIDNRNWLENGSEYIHHFFYSADTEPQYSQGQEAFQKFIMSRIMESGLDLSQVNDKVVLGWVIMEDGSLQGLHVVSGEIGSLNQLLLTIINDLPGTWIPASLDGRFVRYYMAIPFNFSSYSEPFESLELSRGFLIWD